MLNFIEFRPFLKMKLKVSKHFHDEQSMANGFSVGQGKVSKEGCVTRPNTRVSGRNYYVKFHIRY